MSTSAIEIRHERSEGCAQGARVAEACRDKEKASLVASAHVGDRGSVHALDAVDAVDTADGGGRLGRRFVADRTSGASKLVAAAIDKA